MTGSFRSSEAAVHTRVSLMNSLMFIIELVILGSRIETREAPQAARYQTQMIFHKVMFRPELWSRKPNSKQETKQKHTGEKKRKRKTLQVKHRSVFSGFNETTELCEPRNSWQCSPNLKLCKTYPA